MNLIFDIGFNKGRFAKQRFARYPKCKVVGVDANRKMLLNATNFMNNDLIIFNKIMSDIDSQMIPFYVGDQDGISTASESFMQNSRFAKGSKYISRLSNWQFRDSVDSMTLDILIKEFGQPDFIKIDVQGYQRKVLKGLSQKQKVICFQWIQQDFYSLLKCVQHLIKIGYEQFGAIGYFDQGDVFQKATYSTNGDPFLTQPKNYYSWDQLKQQMIKICQSDRRVNYGMFFAR